MGTDLLFGFLLAKLFAKGDAARRPADIIVPTPSSPSSPSSPGALPPAPAPTFPTDVDVPPAPSPGAPPVVPAGFKKAVELWHIKPEVAQTGTVVVGAEGTPAAVSALEATFPRGWEPVKQVSAAEQAQAVALLKSWHEGGLVFAGPATFQGRRCFRMTKHPASSTQQNPQIAPTAPPAPAGPTVPANFPTTPPAPSGPPPFVPNVPLSDERPQRPATGPGSRLITTVHPGEGLATVARRLGLPADGVHAAELRDENVPSGPDNVTWEAKPLSDKTTGGIKKKNRKGGLQPGDRLFVPLAWGAIDPALL